MFTRVTGAFFRALLMALLVALPSLLLPNVSSDTSQITVLVALLAFLMTFIEYNSQYPSIIEFRYASPFNRLRFLALFCTVALLSLLLASTPGSRGFTGVLHSLGAAWGTVLDFLLSGAACGLDDASRCQPCARGFRAHRCGNFLHDLAGGAVFVCHFGAPARLANTQPGLQRLDQPPSV